MKKILVLIIVGLMMVGIGGKASAGSVVAADLNCTNPTGCVQTGEISDGAVANGKIADGAVTDVKITGPISASKVEKPANVVVVAKSGGDFTAIQAAINSINPTAENPYLIKVMPGTYTESIVMKSYVHLQGSGKDTTIIQSPVATQNVIICSMISDVTISDFTIKNGAHGIDVSASKCLIIENNIAENTTNIYISNNSDVIISNNAISLSKLGSWSGGIISDSSNTIVTNSIITDNNGMGIYVSNSTPIITNNVLMRNVDGGIWVMSTIGIPTVKDNIVVSNGHNGIVSNGTSPLYIHNQITDHAYCDINVSSGNPKLMFNTYDKLCANGGAAVGKYNVTSDANDAPLQ